ncbi:uncharacterized protein UHO2_04509 [Ustilago hordei]|uniref:uncharacterized protein n=1 Tax=Ustilago hordei TaxID=120017 RepID=UPI001A421C8A|nr:uncharacterized protein UHO2_04509 [Ustilago hordei]SYW84570.1 uncharacterized protein UHO2_04509 [Ustilago hordei]
MLHYKDMTDIANLGYNDINEHGEELQQPIDDIYQPLSALDTTFVGDIIVPGSTDSAFEYPTNTDDEFPPAAEMHCFQEKLCHSSRLADIGPLPAYNAEAHMTIATNLKLLIKEVLAGPDQIHWQEAIKAKMDGLESMQI